MTRRRALAQQAVFALLGACLVALLGLPLLALFVTSGPSSLWLGLQHPLVASALRLSLFTTSLSVFLVVLLGTPLAWMLAQARGRWARGVETALQLPIVIPPAVAGVALLLAFGHRGLGAGWLYPAGWSLSFSSAAVVLAEIFVSAPFFVQAALSAFRRLDPQLLLVARSLGASPARIFFRLVVPLAAPGLIGGAALSWARALGEFGATLMFAGSLEGTTQTLPLAIYAALESDLQAAQALSVVLVVVAFALLVFVRALLRRSGAAEDIT